MNFQGQIPLVMPDLALLKFQEGDYCLGYLAAFVRAVKLSMWVFVGPWLKKSLMWDALFVFTFTRFF